MSNVRIALRNQNVLPAPFEEIFKAFVNASKSISNSMINA
jgi:hypothetical protein